MIRELNEWEGGWTTSPLEQPLKTPTWKLYHSIPSGEVAVSVAEASTVNITFRNGNPDYNDRFNRPEEEK